MTDFLKRVVDSTVFQFFILAMIVAAAVLVGLETYPSVVERHGGLLHALNRIVLWIFVVEAAIKMAQHGRRFYRYFEDPWNMFDFTIVAVCFLPVQAQYAAVLRLARIMRAMRLMTALPRLQLIVAALIKSIPSMFYVGILLALHFYVYAVMGVYLFRGNDPIHFQDLPRAMLSLFRVVTLEDWTDVMYINMHGSDRYPGPDLAAYETSNSSGLAPEPHAMPGVAAAYFVSFVMFGTMIMLNLFIGVILASMEEAQQERDVLKRQALQEQAGDRPAVDRQARLAAHLQAIEDSLAAIKQMDLAKDGDAAGDS